jgi:anti-sigma regulatory factor (Ser/Thr protein kinase)
MYQRAKNRTGRVPSTVNLHQWSDPAFVTLFELGFFETVGHIVEDAQAFRDSETGDVRTMTLITGQNSTGLQSVSEAILDLSTFIGGSEPMRPDIQKALNSALGEAMSNVAHHAYPDRDGESGGETLNIWWVSASADRTARVLRVVVYDQGATIPVTLPKRTWFAALDLTRTFSATSRDGVVPHPHDADYIEYAMGVGKTQTGQAGRGEGLPQMRELLNICGAGSLMILSRGGVCCYWPDKPMASQALSIPIEGTLIEWEIHLPKAA